MSEFKEYISSILNGAIMDAKSKRDLEDEINDHLQLLKQEFIDNGYTEKDAIQMAMKKFGEAKDIRAKYADSFISFNKYIRIAAIVLFTIYMLKLIQRAFFSPFGCVVGVSSINLVPFESISFYLSNLSKINFRDWFSNLFGLVIAFMPLGFLIPIIHRKINKLYQIIIPSLSVSMIIEIFQHISRRGITDIDDVILNTLGGILGFLALNTTVKAILMLKRMVSSIKMVKS